MNNKILLIVILLLVLLICFNTNEHFMTSNNNDGIYNYFYQKRFVQYPYAENLSKFFSNDK